MLSDSGCRFGQLRALIKHEPSPIITEDCVLSGSGCRFGQLKALMQEDLSCFMAYDLRGRIPDEFNEDIAYRTGRACGELLKPKRMVVGHDIRLSSPAITSALVDGLIDGGTNVYLIGECGTEEVYFSTAHFDMDGGIMVTASHNPKDYNGMKLVREDARPISGDTGLNDLKQLVHGNQFSTTGEKGEIETLDHRSEYIAHLLGYVDIASLKPLRIVVNAGNGGAGAIVDLLEQYLPFEFIRVHHEADGNFPHGVPNPLLIENRAASIDAIRKYDADLGVAWDGDFDRCFFFDANGRFIEGYYIVGLLAQAFLEQVVDVHGHNHQQNPVSSIVHDPRLIWNTIDIVNRAGGNAICSKAGHAFMKERMRLENSVYGGEMSAHHYFRNFSYCDSGMIPWLLVAGLMSSKLQTLAELVNERMAMFPSSGEINRRIQHPEKVIRDIEARYFRDATKVDHTDGLSMEFPDWRFNVRQSNTEALVRLNVESRGDAPLMISKTKDLLILLGDRP